MTAAEKIIAHKLKLNDAIIKIIDKAINETFTSFISISPVLKKCSKSEVSLPDKSDVAGMIAFIQSSLEGTLIIKFKKESILPLLSKLYNEELISIDNKVIGGVAELTNVIHAIVKEELNQEGYNYQMCLPVVIIGENHSMITMCAGPKIIFEYELDNMNCTVELISN
jgi:CheY-specific phosphatase CheX